MRLAPIALLAVSLYPTAAQALEEPSFQVVAATEGYELRQYQPYMVAEVSLQGSRRDVDNAAFRLLFDYISGNNQAAEKIEMTAPVTTAAAPVKIEMTAPVTRSEVPGGYRVQFVLPARFTPANAPRPLDARVQVRQVPGERIAVRRFSGTWSERHISQHLDQLRAALQAADLAIVGEPVLARYNSPFSLPFLRRNEIWLRVEEAPAVPSARPADS